METIAILEIAGYLCRETKQGGTMIVTKPAAKPKRDLTAELCAALREVKEHIEGKRELKSAESLIDEL